MEKKPSDRWVNQKILPSVVDERVKEVFHTDETTSLMCEECNFLAPTRFRIRTDEGYAKSVKEITDHLRTAKHTKFNN